MRTGRTEVLVVADDLTGANAAAAGFARAGLRTVSVSSGCSDDLPGATGRFDVVVVSLDNRHVTSVNAAAQAAAAVRAGWPVRLVCNRVDTTLRGNVGASTAAVLQAVAELSGCRAVALCCPAHPAAGRQTVQGIQLLDGQRLEQTELARDPRSPVHTSDVAALFHAQADLCAAHIPLSVVVGDDGPLDDAVRTALHGGADLVVADALTAAHLERIAQAAVRAAGDDMRWVAVDPGPGSLALAQALGIAGRTGTAPLLALSGSATRLTRTQLTRLVSEHAVTVVRPVPDGASPVPDVGATAAALASALDAAGRDGTVLLATALDGSEVRHISAEDAARLPVALAAATRRALERHDVDGVFATGGDVTAALLAALGAVGVDVTDEVVPLAVAGTLVGGPWAGLPMVTKGGLVGGADTAVDCLRSLRRAADLRRLVTTTPDDTQTPDDTHTPDEEDS